MLHNILSEVDGVDVKNAVVVYDPRDQKKKIFSWANLVKDSDKSVDNRSTHVNEDDEQGRGSWLRKV